MNDVYERAPSRRVRRLLFAARCGGVPLFAEMTMRYLSPFAKVQRMSQPDMISFVPDYLHFGDSMPLLLHMWKKGGEGFVSR
jgi:hypothetical protein